MLTHKYRIMVCSMFAIFFTLLFVYQRNVVCFAESCGV